MIRKINEKARRALKMRSIAAAYHFFLRKAVMWRRAVFHLALGVFCAPVLSAAAQDFITRPAGPLPALTNVAPGNWVFGNDILLDGDMETLSVGTNPDVGMPAGAWGWPQNYVTAHIIEMNGLDMSIVQRSSFDPRTPGKSLMLNNLDTTGNIHLPNLFTRTIDESEGIIVQVNFDIFLPTQGRGGGSIYIGGDHGGGGFSAATDRGPQISWLSDGTIILSPGNVVIVPSYQWGEWQSVQLDIDLMSDSFDMFWGHQGQLLQQVGDDLVFRSGALDHLDRFSYVHFTGLETPAHSAIDNVIVLAGVCDPCDMNCDGEVNAFDIAPFLDLLFGGGDPCGPCAGDTNGDGNVDAFDIEPFLECLFP